jgi:hypothetical protein
MSGKIISDAEKALLSLLLVQSTSRMFAINANPNNRGANFKFTAKGLAELSYTYGLYPRFNSNDRVLLYDNLPDTMSVGEFWMKHSEFWAEQLIQSYEGR